MKKKFSKKLLLKTTSIAQLGQASGGRTMTWGCWSVDFLGCTAECDPDAPGGTIELTDSCNPDGNCW